MVQSRARTIILTMRVLSIPCTCLPAETLSRYGCSLTASVWGNELVHAELRNRGGLEAIHDTVKTVPNGPVATVTRVPLFALDIPAFFREALD